MTIAIMGRRDQVAYAEHGFKRAVFGLIEGFMVSAVVSAFTPTLGESLAVMVRILSILSALILLGRMKYWSLLYILGYFSGLALFGPFFMEPWELPLYLVAIALTMVQKVRRKIA